MANESNAGTIKAGLVGFGFGGRIFHAPFLQATPGLQLAAIMQRSADTAAAAYPQIPVVRSVEALLADESLRLIVVSTPNQTHFDVAKQCLLAKRHVVVDKPITTTAAQAQELVELADKQGVQLFSFHNRRWDGDFLTVKKVLEGGELGRLVTFEGRWDRFRPVPRTGTWKETAEEGTGMLLDLGPHLLDQVLALFGKPASLTGEVLTVRDGSLTGDDAFFITLHYEDGPYKGLRARVSATMVAADPAPRFLLNGTHGSFRKYGLDAQEAALLAGQRPPAPGAAGEWLANPEREWGTLTSTKDNHEPIQLTTRTVPTLPGDYRNFFVAVRDAIQGKPSNATTGHDGLRVLRLVELARASNQAGRTLPVPAENW